MLLSHDSLDTVRELITEDHTNLCVYVFVFFCVSIFCDLVEEGIQHFNRETHTS
jgi:hypothetical protein